MSTAAIRRVAKELKDLNNKPIREFVLVPLESNMLEVHFTMMGPEDSPYSNGLYHGRVLIPAEYPFAPPDVVLLTPNGRFETSKKVCLSVSSYHPEHWKATWGIGTILHSLRNFMLTAGTNGIASINYPEKKRRELADASRTFVCKDCGANVAEQWEETMKNAPPATDADKGELLPPMPPTPATDPSATPQKTQDGSEAGETGKTPPPPMSLPPAGSLNMSPTPQRQMGEQPSYTPVSTSPALLPSASATPIQNNSDISRMPTRNNEGTTSMSFCALTPTSSSAYGNHTVVENSAASSTAPTTETVKELNTDTTYNTDTDVRDEVPSASFPANPAVGPAADEVPIRNASFPQPPEVAPQAVTPQKEAQVEFVPMQAEVQQPAQQVAPPQAPEARPLLARNNIKRHPLHFEISIATIDKGLVLSVTVFILMIIKKIIFDEWFHVMERLNGLYDKYMQ